MSLFIQLPIKFECKHCQVTYFHLCTQSMLHEPHCPQCHHTGFLMGAAEKKDLPLYSITSAVKFIKQSWHRLNKVHS